ncbi:MAG TPA: M23 family metallopeptidase [Flavobacteriales bacterium]|nr:M23 family metallopeptidase [Flavobacteriales bacterium]
MLRNASITALLPALLGSPALAQVDSVAIGGAEEVEAYEEAIEEPGYDELALPSLTGSGALTLKDSLWLIPGYDLYCDWNTESIFGHHAQTLPVAPATLWLSHAACDHEMPVCGRITSAFGPRHGRMHYGVDLKLETGDPVVAGFAGMVRIAQYHRSFGNVVVIRHANGLETLYAHLSRISVDVGQLVEAGERIGLGGNTGRSTGSHLHFEVRYLGRPIDPARVFNLAEGELTASTLRLDASLFERPAAASSAYYRVKRGDTLSSIARRHGTTVARLCKLNRLSTRSILRIGQRLRTS